MSFTICNVGCFCRGSLLIVAISHFIVLEAVMAMQPTALLLVLLLPPAAAAADPISELPARRLRSDVQHGLYAQVGNGAVVLLLVVVRVPMCSSADVGGVDDGDVDSTVSGDDAVPCSVVFLLLHCYIHHLASFIHLLLFRGVFLCTVSRHYFSCCR